MLGLDHICLCGNYVGEAGFLCVKQNISYMLYRIESLCNVPWTLCGEVDFQFNFFSQNFTKKNVLNPSLRLWGRSISQMAPTWIYQAKYFPKIRIRCEPTYMVRQDVPKQDLVEGVRVLCLLLLLLQFLLPLEVQPTDVLHLGVSLFQGFPSGSVIASVTKLHNLYAIRRISKNFAPRKFVFVTKNISENMLKQRLDDKSWIIL